MRPRAASGLSGARTSIALKCAPSALPLSRLRFIVIIPADRKWFRHVYGLALTICVLVSLSLFTFVADTEDTVGRMTVPVLLMAVLFLAKMSHYGQSTPQVKTLGWPRKCQQPRVSREGRRSWAVVDAVRTLYRATVLPLM